MIHELVSIFDSLLGAHKQFPGDEYYYFCPFCHHYKPKFAVNLAKRAWQCWKCNQGGRTLFSLLKRLNVTRDQIQRVATILEEELPRYQNDREDEKITLTLPPEFKPLWESSTLISHRRALNYVLNRGLTMDDILRYQIGYCTEGRYADRVIFPSYDAKGLINYFVGRTLDPDALNYLTPPVNKNIVGFDFHINWNYPIVICEGAFDAAAIKVNAVPLFGKIVSTALRNKIVERNVTDIYLALDADALRSTVKLAETFMAEDRNVYVVPMEGKDPSVIGFNGMQQLIKRLQPLNFLTLLQLKLSLA